LGAKSKRPQVLVCYDLLEGLTNEKEDLLFETKLELFSIGTIIISNETISLSSIRVSKIRINEKYCFSARDIILGNIKSGAFKNKNKRI
jgi:hypothetical protein